MRLLALLLAPALYAQTPGLVQVRAGVLSCGAVMRSPTTIQTYCYAPGLVIVHNALDTLNPSLTVDYHWCTIPGAIPCTPAAITWNFNITASGIAYQYTVDEHNLISGELTKVFGSP
jgi:hypothetical protein